MGDFFNVREVANLLSITLYWIGTFGLIYIVYFIFSKRESKCVKRNIFANSSMISFVLTIVAIGILLFLGEYIIKDSNRYQFGVITLYAIFHGSQAFSILYLKGKFVKQDNKKMI